MSELWFKPAYELAAAIRARQLSPVELMEASLERIEQVNPVLNAFIAMRPEAARRAHLQVWCEKPDGTKVVVGSASAVQA